MASTKQNLATVDSHLSESALLLQQNIGIAIQAGLEHCGAIQDEEHAVFQLIVEARDRIQRLIDAGANGQANSI